MNKYATAKVMAQAARADAEASDFALVQKLTDEGMTVTAITARAVVVEVNHMEIVLTRPLQQEGRQTQG